MISDYQPGRKLPEKSISHKTCFSYVKCYNLNTNCFVENNVQSIHYLRGKQPLPRQMI